MNDISLIAHIEGEPLVGVAALAAAKRAAELLSTGDSLAYLGPGVLAEDGAAHAIPLTPEALAAELNKRHPAPGRIRKDLWAVAQFIEQRRHRKTLSAFMMDIFKPEVAPTELHLRLAALRPPLIVDTWYDGAMRAALSRVPPGLADWGEIQGVTRAVEAGAQWWKNYDAAGALASDALSLGWRTALYKPHGAVEPAGQALVADNDYVEVLTEIDIQTPIPDIVRQRREGRGFVFLGCRFHDQMLRTYARQIIKRSGGGHYAFVDPAILTVNERRFFAAQDITSIALPPSALTPLLAAI